jgi:hypothetical protein
MPMLAPAPPFIPSHLGQAFDVEVNGESVGRFLARFATTAGIQVTCLGDLTRPLALHLSGATIEEVLAAACHQGELEVRRAPEGGYEVGYGSDLVLEHAGVTDTTWVDLIYRPSNIDAHSIGKLIGLAFPELKVFAGPSTSARCSTASRPLPRARPRPGRPRACLPCCPCLAYPPPGPAAWKP